MKNRPSFLIYFCCIALFVPVGLSAQPDDNQPIKLHPDNPHYFLYRGQPTLLITSAEHYGAVLNTDFDYVRYLSTLEEEGMNYTRIFTGSYVEIEGSFGITQNTLGPKVGSFLAPWARVAEEGLYRGEQKFDLERWNPDYFERLRDFVGLAEKKSIVVEVTFFCSTYRDDTWERNPFNPGNNINGLPVDLDRKTSNTLKNGKLSAYQRTMVAKIVAELNEFDNVFYEIQNEPWSDDPQPVMRTLRTLNPQPGSGGWFKWSEEASPASLDWQQSMAKVVTETEQALPKKHLIAQNYTNFKHSLPAVSDDISILNFHYAWPEAVWMNYAWNRPVCFDESGFAGQSDTTYLRQAWQFMLAGGAMFNNLDYSFFTGHEDGKGVNDAPGGGSTRLRRQLKFLHEFMRSFDFIAMNPDFQLLEHAPGMEGQVLSEPGRQYAVILTGKSGNWVQLNLPRGRFNCEVISPFTGEILLRSILNQKKGQSLRLEIPGGHEMLAVRITR